MSSSGCLELPTLEALQETTSSVEFIVSDTRQTFQQGRDFCYENGAQVVSILNDAENEAVQSLLLETEGFSPVNSAYIGLVAENLENVTAETLINYFNWVDGTNLAFGRTTDVFPWATGEPRLDLNSESVRDFKDFCAVFDVRRNGWASSFCSDDRLIVCKKSCNEIPATSVSTPVIIVPVLIFAILLALGAIIFLRLHRRRVEESKHQLDMLTELSPAPVGRPSGLAMPQFSPTLNMPRPDGFTLDRTGPSFPETPPKPTPGSHRVSGREGLMHIINRLLTSSSKSKHSSKEHSTPLQEEPFPPLDQDMQLLSERETTGDTELESSIEAALSRTNLFGNI